MRDQDEMSSIPPPSPTLIPDKDRDLSSNSHSKRPLDHVRRNRKEKDNVNMFVFGCNIGGPYGILVTRRMLEDVGHRLFRIQAIIRTMAYPLFVSYYLYPRKLI